MADSVLVTGGAGYIGSVLVPALLEAGHKVTVLDLFREGDGVLAPCCQFDGFLPVRGDVRDEPVMRDLLRKADIILPLAGLVGAPLCARDPLNATSVNLDAIIMAVKMTSKSQRLVFPTTNSGYGIGIKDQYCTEETPLKPISLYGLTKVEAERAILNSGNGVTLRLATVFGMSPRMRIDLLVNDFTYRAVTDRAVIVFEGHFKRNYVHIRDVAKAFLHAIENYNSMNSNAYNVGLSDANLSKLELCAVIKQQVPDFYFAEASVGKDPDRRDYVVSNAKLEATGWLPDWPLDRGIQELIKGFTMLRNQRFSNG